MGGGKQGLRIVALQSDNGAAPGSPLPLTLKRPWIMMNEKRAPCCLRDLILKEEKGLVYIFSSRLPLLSVIHSFDSFNFLSLLQFFRICCAFLIWRTAFVTQMKNREQGLTQRPML